MSVEQAIDLLVAKQWDHPREVVADVDILELISAIGRRVKESRSAPRVMLRLFFIEGKLRQCLK